MAERNVKLQVRCVCCNQIKHIMVTEESAIEYMSPNRRNIQLVFPYLNAEERELLISKICPECWNKMFGEDEDDYEEDYEPTAEDLKEWQDASCGRV